MWRPSHWPRMHWPHPSASDSAAFWSVGDFALCGMSIGSGETLKLDPFAKGLRHQGISVNGRWSTKLWGHQHTNLWRSLFVHHCSYTRVPFQYLICKGQAARRQKTVKLNGKWHFAIKHAALQCQVCTVHTISDPPQMNFFQLLDTTHKIAGHSLCRYKALYIHVVSDTRHARTCYVKSGATKD